LSVIAAIMRIFSYLFHALLALFLLAVSGLALATGADSLRLGMLPWTGPTLAYAVFFGSLFGLITVVLAVLGKIRLLFFLWSLAVAYFAVRGYIFSSYRFAGSEWQTALCIILAALIALLGALLQMWKRSAKKPRYT
jgi:hypothetical protein